MTTYKVSGGIDEKLILDRTDFTKIDEGLLIDNSVYSLHICDKQYDFFYKDGKCIYGEEVGKYTLLRKDVWNWLYRDKLDKGVYISMPGRPSYEDRWMYTEPVPSKINKRLKHPILLQHHQGKLVLDKGYRYQTSYYPFPILKHLDFQKVVKPEDMWLMLSEWLSKRKEVPVKDTRTNKEKILSKGFDLVKSFRHRK